MNRFLLLCCLFSVQLLSAQPILWISDCSDKTFCFNPGTCAQGNVLLTEKAVTNCAGSSNINYLARVDLNNDSSVDFTISNDTVIATYPAGTHKITWRASDNCFNVTTCTYTFTIKDCFPPNMLCLSGVNQVLTAPECEASFDPDQFILTLNDNCTPLNQIEKRIRKFGDGTGFPSTTSVTFGECNQGTNFVEVWTRDANGLTNSCQNYVIVQTNNSGCDCNPDGDLNMQTCVRTPANKKISHYTLSANIESTGGVQTPVNKQKLATTTDSCSAIAFDKLPFGGNYRAVLRASRIGDNPLEGVSTFDLVVISKHILNVDPFDNIYQVLAADVNRNGTVTATDIVEIRKLILGLYDTLPGISSPWRFVQPAADPGNLQAPLSTLRDTYQINLTNLNTDFTFPNLPFIAVKYGDLNASAAFAPDGDDRGLQNYALYVKDVDIQNNQSCNIPIYVRSGVELEGLQMSLSLPLEAAEWLGVEGLPAEAWYIDPAGLLHISFVQAAGIQWAARQTAFTLRLRAKVDFRLSDYLALEQNRLKPEIYCPDDLGKTRRHTLRLLPEYQGRQALLSPPSPNPFSHSVLFQMNLPEAGFVQLDIHNAAGRLIHSEYRFWEAGLYDWRPAVAEWPGTGAYFYRLTIGNNVFNGKLIRL